MFFEGILINKIVYKERDLIVKLLLRSGLVGSFYIYGGQGGGKNMKPTLFELGSMMKIQVKETRKKTMEGADLMVASEYQRTWEPKKIRYEVKAYYLLCLYLEILQKLAQPFHPMESDGQQSDSEGIFSVASNAIFYLDHSLEAQSFEPSQQLSLFMVKLLFHLGIMPNLETCGLCGVDLDEAVSMSFQAGNGHFACGQCSPGNNERGFMYRMRMSYQTKFQDYQELKDTSPSECDKLIQYFCHQFHLKPIALKSYSLLFK